MRILRELTVKPSGLCGNLFYILLKVLLPFQQCPIAISSILGIILCFVSFVSIVFIIIRELIWQGSAYGWPSAICIILLLFGIQLFSIGVLGQYLAKTYLEVKRRPIYIIKECKFRREGKIREK